MTVPIFKQGDTAHIIDILMTSSTDHVTPKTGLGSAVTVTLTKNGGAFGAAAGTVAEIGNGHYGLTPTAVDTGTLGLLGWHATGAGADPSDGLVEIVAFDPFDATRFGLTALPNAVAGAAGGLPTGDASGRVTVATVAASAINAASFAANALDAVWSTATRSLTTLAATGNANDIAAAVWNALAASYNAANSMGNILGNTSTAAQLATAVWANATRSLTDKTGFSLSANALDAAQFTQAAADKVWSSTTRALTASLDPSASAIAAAVFSYVTEPNWTFLGVVRVASSALFGKSNTTGDTFRDVNDTKNRITATVDALSNRTAVVTDQT